MSEVTEFLTPDQEKEIVEAIRLAESVTSGEIRVHLEHASEKNHFERAKEVFHLLKMDETQLKNGVLFYLAVHDHVFVILGDKGIDDVVENDFWDCTRDAMSEHFKKGDFKNGLISGIQRAGDRLKTYFPWREGDTNELSNEISKG